MILEKLWGRSLLVLMLAGSVSVYAQDKPKEWAEENYRKYTEEARSVSDLEKERDIEAFRKRYSETGSRRHEYSKHPEKHKTLEEARELLGKDGIFKDLVEEEVVCFAPEGHPDRSRGRIEAMSTEVWIRLGKMADAIFSGKLSRKQVYTPAYLKAIIHYGTIEISRSNHVSRFHESCFLIPTTAMNIYFAFLKDMDRIEKAGDRAKPLEKEACDLLKTVALQAWTQPIRGDETDNDVTSLERFRHHVWWVGGNALAYRSLLPVACMYKSVPMIDLLQEVAQKGISATSHLTNETSFWTEGFTVDGAGWGHGKQCLVWGYPIDGTGAALDMLSEFKGSSWEVKLNDENKSAILNYLRGGSWYYHKGYIPPCLDRGSTVWKPGPSLIKYHGLLENIMKNWKDSFTSGEIRELEQLAKEVKAMEIGMEGYPAGWYTGSRYFYSNDDLMKKTKDYEIFVNMASVRCDGLESATDKADEWNFCSCDGLTLFLKSGREYEDMLGGADVLQAPGVTSRIGEEKLKPVTNWRGYCSQENFAGGATLDGENAVAGYIFDKMNASAKKYVNDKIGLMAKNEVLYGIKAYKSYFFFGDYFLALGAGITNNRPEVEGAVRTTIEQTGLQNKAYLFKGGEKVALGKKAEGKLVSASTPASCASELTWLVQEGKFAYAALPEYTREAFYSIRNVKNDWVRKNIVNKVGKNLPANADVLHIGIEHGDAPVNDTYGYVVHAGKGMPAARLPFEVLRNDIKVQAAATLDGKVVEAVFYDSSSVLKAAGQEIRVSAPCVLLLENAGASWNLSVTDACMDPELKSIKVSVGDRSVEVQMPQEKFCGKPAKATLK